MAPRITTRLAASLPAGAAVVLFVAAATLGGSTFSSLNTDAPPEPMADADASVPHLPKADLDDSHLALAAVKPKPTTEPTPMSAPEATPPPAEAGPVGAVDPAPAPVIEAKPPQPVEEPKPPTTNIGLEAWLKDGKIKLAWTPFWGDGFAYYKLVRTTDGDPTWPPSGDDQLIAAIGNPQEAWWADRPACGATHFYRVFAVRSGATGSETLAASNVTSGALECPAPQPPALELGFTVAQTESGIGLTWQPYTGGGFIHYKVVRSQTNSDPLYPLNEGTELIGVIGDPNEVSFVDGDVAPGQTWFYRVLAMADHGYGKWAAGKTPAVSITVQ